MSDIPPGMKRCPECGEIVKEEEFDVHIATDRPDVAVEMIQSLREQLSKSRKDLEEETRVCGRIKDSNLRLSLRIRAASEWEENQRSRFKGSRVHIDVIRADLSELRTALDLATPTKWNVVDFFKSLTKEQMQELLHATALITDPLGQELIRKACEEE